VQEAARRVTRRLKAKVVAPDFPLKCIVVWKVCKAALLILVAVGAFAAIHRDLHAAAEHLIEWLGLDPTSARIEHLLAKLEKVTTAKLAFAGSGAIVFAAFFLVEAWGLWNRRIWAELLTMVATSLLVPVEVYELCRHPGAGKVLTLVVNVAIVLYLARHHYLFVPGPIGRWLHAHLGSHESGRPEGAPR